MGAALAAAAVLSAVGVSIADTQADNGDLGGSPSPNLFYGGGNGHDCATRGTPINGEVTLSYGGGSHYTAGAPVTLDITPDAASIGAGIDVAQTGTTSIPATWDTHSADVKVPFTTTVPALTPDGVYKVEVVATDGTFSAPGHHTYVIHVHCTGPVPANTAPDVSDVAGAGSVNEGDDGTYSVTATDPDSDALTYAWQVVSGDALIPGDATSDSVSVHFSDGPSTVVLQVVVDDGSGHTVTRTKTISEADVAPTTTFVSGDTSVDESSTTTHTYTYTISDPGNDTQTPAVSCGDLGTLSNANATDVGGSFDCTFPDGANPATTSAVTATSTDSDGVTGNTATLNVTVNDVAPTVAFTSGDTTVNEGSATHSYTYTISDPGNDTQTGAASCGALGTLSNATNTATGGSFDCTFPDGLVPATTTAVTVQATDSDGLAGNTDTKTVTVNNVTPVVSALTLGGNTGTACLDGKVVTLDFSFTDPGADSPWGVDLNWGDGSTHTTYNALLTGAQAQRSHTYIGAGSWTVGASVTDKDGATGSNSSAANAVKLLYSTGLGILQPINYTGPRSAFKIGSTIPVKIKITDCHGNPVPGLSPQVSLKFIDGTPDGTSLEDVVSTVPDQGTTMRYTGAPDNQYIYNLATKGRAVGDYTVTVSDPTIAPISATFSMKK